ncbi:hypothetical protein Tco_0505964 [Tanacetum coccineum]
MVHYTDAASSTSNAWHHVVGENLLGRHVTGKTSVLSSGKAGDEINEVQDQGYIGGRYFGSHIVISDSEDSTFTYTAVSSPFEGLSDIGSPGVDGPPMMLEDPYAYMVAAFQAPSSPDYVHGPEEPEQAPLLPEFVPKPVYLEFMPPKDEEDEEDPEEDLTDYPTDGGDDDDDDDESSDDDKDDDDDVEEDEDEEEEEHLAPADSVSPPVHRVTARMSIREQPPTPFWSEAEIARLLDIPSPPPSPLSPWSSPLPQISSPSLLVSSPVLVSPPPLPASPTYPLGYRAAMIQLRAETPSTSHPLPSSTSPLGAPPLLPIPLPTPSPPLLIPSTVCRAGVSEVTLPPRKRLCIALGLRYEVGESSSAPTARPTGGLRLDYGFVATLDDEIRRDLERDVGYRITNTWDEMLVGMPGAPTTDDTELGRRMIDFVTAVRQDTNEVYGRLDDAQDDRLLMSGRLNMLYRDRRAHAHTTKLMETEARLSREAWVQSMDASDTARSRLYFKGTEGVIELTQWFERMETVFRISNCFVENQIKFATCTLLRSALTWWNSHVKTVGHDVAHAMTWTNLKKKMTEKYCPMGEIKKLEVEM